MLTAPKKIRRLRSSDELVVEQTHDLVAVSPMLQRAGITTAATRDDRARCFLMAHQGSLPVGVAALDTQVDAALLRALYVLEPMRGRGVGASLVRAARMAAHTRGARTLYAAGAGGLVDYLVHLGFTEVDFAKIAAMFGEASTCERTRPSNYPDWGAVRLDISRDGLIER
jgi:N-acetylglutamate synthase-like GNAT family acetyltransferase